MNTISRTTLAALTLLVGGVGLYCFTRTPARTPEASAPGAAQVAIPPDAPSGTLTGRAGSPAVLLPSRQERARASAERIAALAEKLRALSTNDCSGDCEQKLLALAASVDLTDANEALALGDKTLPENSRRLWRRTLLTRLAEGSREDAVRALDYAKSLESDLERMEALQVAMMVRSDHAPAEAWQWFHDNADALEHSSFAVELSSHLAQNDPATARRLIENLPAGTTKDQALAGLALGWSQRNFQEAIEWTKTLPPENQQQILLGLAPQWVEQDFKAATAHAASLPTGEARTEFVAAVAQHGVQTRLNETAKWAQSLPEGDDRNRALVELAGEWSKRSLSESVDFVSKLPAGTARDEALVRIVSESAQENPALMAQWLKDFPDGDARRNGLTALAERWVTSDPVQAAEWARSLPADQASPEISSAVATGLFSVAPDAALKWVESIPDDGTRLTTVTQILSRHDNAAPLIEAHAPGLRKFVPPLGEAPAGN